MSVTALHLYEQLTEAADDKARAKVIAETFGRLAERYPQFRELATPEHIQESELMLKKEIEVLASRLNQIEFQLSKEITDTKVKITDTCSTLILWIGSIAILQTIILGWLLL
jgi:hypothetical protein